MVQRPKRPRDPAQIAKLMVDIATGEVEEGEPTITDTFSGRFLRNAGNIIRRSPSRIRDFGEAEHDSPA